MPALPRNPQSVEKPIQKKRSVSFANAWLTRDEGKLSILLSGKNLTFGEWADWFLEKRSKPPFRARNTHQQNLNTMKFLRPAFGQTLLSDITPEAIEDYLAQRLTSGRWVRTNLGRERRGELKPSTVHLEFRVLNYMLNLAVKQKRLAINPCGAVEFPAPIRKCVRKPHYMTSSEQARIELVAPPYVRNLVVILTEMGLRPYKELLPMKKSDVDLENSFVYVPDSKTQSGIGDMPLTELAREAFRARSRQPLGLSTCSRARVRGPRNRTSRLCAESGKKH